MEIRSITLLGTFAFLALIHTGNARDLRNVTEPKAPQTCKSLKASGSDDSEAIKNALDSCAKGKAVALSAGVFYSGPLTIPSGVSLLVEKGATLKAIPNPTLYDLGAKTCGTLDEYGVGCKAFITMHEANGSGIYGKGTIDGQANVTMTGKNMTWWELSDAALVKGNYQNNPRLIQINNSLEITLHQITLINSPFYTVATSETYGFTVWGVTIYAPESARNTDGIDPIGSQNVTIAHCNISNGDDNVAIKAMTAPSRHISVLNNHFHKGRGMSIGSEVNYGASDVFVSGLTVHDTVNGVHIKSNTFRGGHVVNISYENICMRNVQHPIYLEMTYMNLHGNRTPEFRNINFNNIKVLTKGTYIVHGISKSNPVHVTLNNVHITKGSQFSESFADITGKFLEDVSGGDCAYSGNA
ncbi:endo-polygalacturonase-like [Bacillus rossius redtenbacheri]|uniref:endo-polygalacturonase-like n=1 Tax=Bacillus rossius redtenbacheri TaxID=93214 RepID=UPI002FDE3A6B